MPQPDNQRQRGAATQTTQQRVSPQGQMSGSISPISGGAAAAAPVLQIGQQAQIKQTGAELYQMLQGAFQGAAAGLDAYQKMYKLQSEKDYAEFETEYATQLEKTNNDPKRMKLWLDNNTYKPNRVTAKRYHTLRADISGKDYLAHQQDEWNDIQLRLSKMALPQAMEWANNNINQYDESSPVHQNLQSYIIQGSGKLAAAQRSLATTQLSQEMTQDSLGFVQRLHGSGFMDVSGPEMYTVMQARSLGLVQEMSKQDGSMALVYNGQEFNPNTIPLGLQETLHEEIGQIAMMDPDRVAAAMDANKLPQGALQRTGGAMTEDAKRALRASLFQQSSNGGPEWKAILGSFIGPETDNPQSFVAGMFSSTIEQIKNSNELSEQEKLVRLNNVEQWFDFESNQGLYEELGITSKEQLDGLYRKERNALTAAQQAQGAKISIEGADTVDQHIALSVNATEMMGLSRAVFQNQIVPYLSTVATEDNPVLITGFTKRKMSKAPGSFEYAGGVGYDYVPMSIDLRDFDGEMEQGFIPAAITLVDPNMSGKVSFGYNFRGDDLPDGVNTEGVFIGTANTDKIPPNVLKRLEAMTVGIREARAAESLITGESYIYRDLNIVEQNALMQRGMDRIVAADPMTAVGVLAINRTNSVEVLSEESARNLALTFTPDRIFEMDPNQRQAISEAFVNNQVFQAEVTKLGGSTEAQEKRTALFQFGHLMRGVEDVPMFASLLRLKIPSKINSASQDLRGMGAAQLLEALQAAKGLNVPDTDSSGDLKTDMLLGFDLHYQKYSNGSSLEKDLASEDPRIRQNAVNFIQSSSRQGAMLGNLRAAGVNDKTINTFIRQGRYQDNALALYDPDRLYFPGSDGTSMTATTQVFYDFAKAAIAEADGKIEAAADLLGLDKSFVKRIAEGEPISSEELTHQLSVYENRNLVSFVPAVDGGSGVRGLNYSDRSYSVIFNRDGMDAFSPELQDTLTRYFMGPDVRITRRAWDADQAPKGARNGSQVYVDRETAIDEATAKAALKPGIVASAAGQALAIPTLIAETITGKEIDQKAAISYYSSTASRKVWEWWNGRLWTDRQTESEKDKVGDTSNVARGTGLLAP